MTDEEADQKAKELYGPKAMAEIDRGWFQIVVNEDLDGRWLPEFGPLKTLLGWGSSWESAFEMAETRNEWHGYGKEVGA